MKTQFQPSAHRPSGSSIPATPTVEENIGIPRGQYVEVNTLAFKLPGRIIGQDIENHVIAENLENCRKEFVAKYGVKVLVEGQVSFTLPSGTSSLDLLNEAQVLILKLLEQPAVCAEYLMKCGNDAIFTTKVTEATSRSIDGNVVNSALKTRAEQEERGWNNVHIADLTIAHLAYLIATGKDLFNGNIVRARGGALVFSNLGLSISDITDNIRNHRVAASLLQ